MKILLISSVFYPKKGGVEKVVENIANEFKKQKQDVTVLSSLYFEQSKSSLLQRFKNSLTIYSEKFKLHGYNVYRIWMGMPASFFGFPLFVLKAPLSFIYILKVVKKLDPDIINLHFPDASSLYVFLLTFFYKRPIVVNIHGNDLHIFAKKFPYKYFISKLIHKSSRIIVNSDYMKNDLLNAYPSVTKKVIVIKNGIYRENFVKYKPKHYFKAPYFFYVGRFVHKKGVDVLIKAFKMANISDVKLLIEGKGEELNKNMKLVEDLQLQSKVVFTKGSLTDKKKISFMKGSIGVVIPSRVEPFGIVAIEAMASGIPTIVSKTGGLKDIIEDGVTGIFFENENVKDLAKKMKQLYKDKVLRDKLSKNGSKESEKYDWSNISKKYLKVYKDAAV